MNDLGYTLAQLALLVCDTLAVVLVSAVLTVSVLLLLGWGVQRVARAAVNRFWR